MSATTSTAARLLGMLVTILLLVLPGMGPASAQDGEHGPEVAELRDGRRVTGGLVEGEGGAIAFEPDSGTGPIALDRIARIERGAADVEPPSTPAPQPFILAPGFDERLSGRLIAVDEGTIRLDLGPVSGEVTVDRRAASSLVQRPGEARVVVEGFDGEPDRDRWEISGGVEVGPFPDADGPILMLSPDDAEARLRLPEPIDAGRVELSFGWEDHRVAGRRWFIDLVFDGPNGEEITRVVLGWADPFPSVESRGGPEMVVQPLVLEAGWHRLTARFGPGRTLLAIDGDDLGRGGGPRGSLVAIRLLVESSRDAESAGDLFARVDNLLAVRSFEPTTSPELDPSQDEIRMVTGDQVWGEIRSADGEGIRANVLDRLVDFTWSQVAGLYFRRVPIASDPIAGPLVRVDWEAGDPEGRPDRIEGVLDGLDDASLRVATPYAGTIAVPRDRLHRLEILGRGLRKILDPHARHLGDQLMPELDPPMPDSDRHELSFSLDDLPERPAELVIDSVQVEGEFEGGRFVEDLSHGFLRTTLSLNGQEFDHLNRHVHDPNRTPARLRIPLPPDLLQEGENTLTFQQHGRETEEEYRDDLGLLRIALEWPETVEDQP